MLSSREQSAALLCESDILRARKELMEVIRLNTQSGPCYFVGHCCTMNYALLRTVMHQAMRQLLQLCKSLICLGTAEATYCFNTIHVMLIHVCGVCDHNKSLELTDSNTSGTIFELILILLSVETKIAVTHSKVRSIPTNL